MAISNVIAFPLENLAERKDQMLGEALAILQATNEIDERDSHVANWSDLYDRYVGKITSIEQLVGIMKIEMIRRRAERLHERQTKNPITGKFEPCTEVASTGSQRARDAELRVVLEEPEAVQEYMDNEVAAHKVPRVHKVIEHARHARNLKAKNPVRAKSVRKVGTTRAIAKESAEAAPVANLYAAIERFADGEFHESEFLNNGQTIPGLPIHIKIIRACGGRSVQHKTRRRRERLGR